MALQSNIPIISIPLRGYVQSRAHTSGGITTLQKWIPSASWNPVPGCLASNTQFKADVTRSQNPNDQWTEMIVFWALSLGNLARWEKKQGREVNHYILTNIALSIRFSGLSLEVLIGLMEGVFLYRLCMKRRLPNGAPQRDRRCAIS